MERKFLTLRCEGTSAIASWSACCLRQMEEGSSAKGSTNCRKFEVRIRRWRHDLPVPSQTISVRFESHTGGELSCFVTELPTAGRNLSWASSGFLFKFNFSGALHDARVPSLHKLTRLTSTHSSPCFVQFSCLIEGFVLESRRTALKIDRVPINWSLILRSEHELVGYFSMTISSNSATADSPELIEIFAVESASFELESHNWSRGSNAHSAVFLQRPFRSRRSSSAAITCDWEMFWGSTATWRRGSNCDKSSSYPTGLSLLRGGIGIWKVSPDAISIERRKNKDLRRTINN